MSTINTGDSRRALSYRLSQTSSFGPSIGRFNDGWNIFLVKFHISKINIINLDLSLISVLETHILFGLYSKGLLIEYNFRRKSKEIVLLNIY